MELNHAAPEEKKGPNVKMLISHVCAQRSDGTSLPLKHANNGITRRASDYNRSLCRRLAHAMEKDGKKRDASDFNLRHRAPAAGEKGRRRESRV